MYFFKFKQLLYKRYFEIFITNDFSIFWRTAALTQNAHTKANVDATKPEMLHHVRWCCRMFTADLKLPFLLKQNMSQISLKQLYI